MTGPSAMPPARIYTSRDTILFVDPASGGLRHGSIDANPKNAALEAVPGPPGVSPRGRLVEMRGDSILPIILRSDGGLSSSEGEGSARAPKLPVLNIVYLERGLVGLECDGVFLCGEGDGSVTFSKRWCRLWEFFLLSEDWCYDTLRLDNG